MTEEEWARFVGGDGDEIRRICRVPNPIVRWFQAYDDILYVRREYAQKLVYKHNIAIHELPLIEIAIHHGIARSDKLYHAMFVYEDRSVTGRSLKATIKTNRKGSYLFLCTFHKVLPGEASRLIRKHKPIP